MTKTTLFMGADEVAEELGVSKPMAYKLIRKVNSELSAMGYITITGRVNRKYFLEKFYGAAEANADCEEVNCCASL